MKRYAATALGFGALLAFGLVMPSVLSTSQMVSASLGVIFAIAGLSVLVITGWTGQTSLAQVSFMGVGAYVTGRLVSPDVGAPLLLAAPASMAAAAAVSVFVGLPALRLRGIYLAIVTLAFAQVLEDAVFNNQAITGSQDGLYVPRPSIGALDLSSDRTLYYVCIAVLCLACVVVAAVRRSSFGRSMMSLNTTEVGASVRGIGLTGVKLLAFAFSASLAGLAGALLAIEIQSVGPASFNPIQSIFLLGLVVMLGRQTILGAALAGILYGAMPPALTRLFGDSTVGPNASNLVVGAGILVVLIGRQYLLTANRHLPARLMGLIQRGDVSSEVLRDVPA